MSGVEGEAAAAPTARALAEWLAACRTWSEEALSELVPPAQTRPVRLHRAMHHALFSGGKRVRPALLRTVTLALGGEDGEARVPGAAVELIHTYSLVHDDLPCMDDDALRRGRPTVHVAFDEATAVLVGDALQALAFGLLAGQASANELVAILARAAGSVGMVGGQAIDLSLERDGAPGELQRVDELHALKTAALFAAACEMGSVVAGAKGALRREVHAYGLTLGRLFQAVDDVLDVVGDAATLGKTPGKDHAHDRTTLVAVLGLEGARHHAGELAGEARERARALGWGPGEPAHDVIDFVLSRSA